MIEDEVRKNERIIKFGSNESIALIEHTKAILQKFSKLLVFQLWAMVRLFCRQTNHGVDGLTLPGNHCSNRNTVTEVPLM